MEDDTIYHLNDCFLWRMYKVWENNWLVSRQCWRVGWSGNIGRSKHWPWKWNCFTSVGSDHFKKMIKMSMVSNPVVTAVESNCIWFVCHWLQIKGGAICL